MLGSTQPITHDDYPRWDYDPNDQFVYGPRVIVGGKPVSAGVLVGTPSPNTSSPYNIKAINLTKLQDRTSMSPIVGIGIGIAIAALLWRK